MKKRRKKPPNHTKRAQKSAANINHPKPFVDWEPIVIIVGFGVLFAGGFWFRGTSPSIGFLFGAYLGFAALPIIDSKKYPDRWRIRSILGGMAGGGLAIRNQASPQIIVYSAIAGMVFGLFAPFWARYV